MGKINLGFNHITDNNKIQELSVVFYADSFFYGLWSDDFLEKAGYHPLESLDNTLELINYNHDIKRTRIISAVKPFVHLDTRDYSELDFDVYFKGLYNLERVADHSRNRDEFKWHTISTLHFIDESLLNTFKIKELPFDISHISTAMSYYSFRTQADLICHIENNKLHLSLLSGSQFRLYNQFDCYHAEDFLYYLSFVFQEFKLDPNTLPVNIGGNILKTSELYELLTRYMKNVNFVDNKLKSRKTLPKSRNHYYDLYLCKSCVS